MRTSHRARIERILNHTADTRSLFLRVEGRPQPHLAGQFISISIPLADETRTRAYSIASNPGDELLEICFNRVPGGIGVEWLFARAAGDTLEFTGPFGAFSIDQPPASEMVFVAENTAIAPIRPMLHRVTSVSDSPALLLYGATGEDCILYRSELEELANRHPNFRFETLIVKGSADALWTALYEEAQRRWVERDSDRTRHFYLCGVGRGVIRMRDLLRGAGYERRSVHYEQW